MSWDDFVQSLTYDQEDIDQEEWREYLEQLEWLHSNPLDINSATPEEMAILPFLTPAQIEAIQAYVHLDGPMKSLGELALIPELDFHTRQVLPLFFIVRDKGRSSKRTRWFGNMKNSLDSRLDIPLYYRKGYQMGKYIGYPIYNRVRYSLESDHVAIGAHAKKDPGELFYDSYGGYAMIKNKGVLRTAIVGDYRAGWGEGLVVGRGYTSKSNLMSTSSQGVRPMTGVSESGFLHGVAITLGNNAPARREGSGYFAFKGTLFASYLPIDATLNKEGEAKTIVKDGYHRSKTELAKRHNTRTALVGAHLQADIGRFCIGGTGYWQHFSRTLSPGNDRYRRWYPKGTDFGVFGLHAGYSYYRWTASAEVAYSTEKAGIATLGRVSWLVSRNLKLGVLGRYYDHRYHSFQASAIGEGTNVQNEAGAMIRIEARPFSKLSISAYADFFGDYWPRYGMTTSSYGQEVMAEGTFTCSDKHSLSARYQLKRKAAYDQLLPHHKIKMQWSFTPTTKWKMQTSAYIHMASSTKPGLALSQLVQGKMLKNDALRVGLMVGYFNAPSYTTRVYMYECQLWNSTSFSSYYGHGLRFSSTIRYTFPKSYFMLEAKYSLTHMFDRKTISSGWQEILSPTRHDISVQARIMF